MAKQASLFEFMSRGQNSTRCDSKIEISDESASSPSVFKLAHPSKKPDFVSTSTPLNSATSNGGGPTSKFKFVPVKRKSCSIIEISDGDLSRSPEKVSPIAKRTSRNRLYSDDIFAELEVSDNRTAETKTNLDAIDIYDKYATPEKKKTEVKQLTPKDKFDLEKELNADTQYVTAMKKLNEKVEQVQNANKSEATLPTPLAGKGKFKFNKPRSASSSSPIVPDTNGAVTGAATEKKQAKPIAKAIAAKIDEECFVPKPRDDPVSEPRDDQSKRALNGVKQISNGELPKKDTRNLESNER